MPKSAAPSASNSESVATAIALSVIIADGKGLSHQDVRPPPGDQRGHHRNDEPRSDEADSIGEVVDAFGASSASGGVGVAPTSMR